MVPIRQPVMLKVLAGAGNGDGALPHAGPRGHRDMLAAVEDVLVDLVGDGPGPAMLPAQLGDAGELARGVSTRPEGLPGVLTTMARVRPENTAARRSRSSGSAGEAPGTKTGLASQRIASGP